MKHKKLGWRKFRRAVFVGVLWLSVACAGFSRDCASCMAREVSGADWIVVQYNLYGNPVNCWPLRGVGIANEASSDGIFWRDGSGHLMHLSGQYSYIQVSNEDFGHAANVLGIDLRHCPGGRYTAGVTSKAVE